MSAKGNQLTVAVEGLSALANVDKEELLKKLQQWNKEKAYPATPVQIEISADGVKDNAEEIGKIVSIIKDYTEDVAKNTLDAEGVANAKATIGAIGTWLIETRKIQTNPLKEIAGHFTPHEAKFKDFSKTLQDAIDRINEKEYEKTEKVIRAYFLEVLTVEQMTETVSMDTFKEFIEKKRKTQCTTSKGALEKKTKDAIDKAILDVVLPIKEARELEKRKALQSKQFGAYLDNTPSDGETAVLEASITTLHRFKEQIAETYPDIQEDAMRRINERIATCEANIRANEAEAKRKAQEDVDKDILATVEEIEIGYMEESLDMIQSDTETLRGLYRQAKLTTTQDKIKTVADLLARREAELTPKPEAQAPMKKQEPEVESEPTETVWAISREDLDVLLFTKVTATTEDEAKRKFIEAFSDHLEMIDLNKEEK